ncbi:hypothetical protein NE237_021648 [Protea cynaroides]|uniref:Uncharacterized protein n=1 Tax=Protea cynaroides TaxID=273540 RepID=A0A9Q0H8X8_9MAGN|nr:hypothetical protein NE237_021648 [Protea cynaroides]
MKSRQNHSSILSIKGENEDFLDKPELINGATINHFKVLCGEQFISARTSTHNLSFPKALPEEMKMEKKERAQITQVIHLRTGGLTHISMAIKKAITAKTTAITSSIAAAVGNFMRNKIPVKDDAKASKTRM